MTADGLGGKMPAWDPAGRGSPIGPGIGSGAEPAARAGELPLTGANRAARDGPLPLERAVGLCDKLLGEVGRRRHLFSWLRAPGSEGDSWLPVEAYYPCNRLVVMCRTERTQHNHLVDELVPRHGLRLLALEPADLAALGGEREAAEHLLAVKIAALPPLARRSQLQAEPEGVLARTLASVSLPSLAALARRASNGGAVRAGRDGRAAGAARAAGALRDAGRAHSAGVAVTRTRMSAPVWRDRPALGIVAGMALAVVCCAEVYVAVFAVALSGGRIVLAVGIALDAFARAIGTIAESRAANESWAWACAIAGSPAVAAFTLWRRLDPIPVQAAPLAGPISLLAMLAAAAGLL